MIGFGWSVVVVFTSLGVQQQWAAEGDSSPQTSTPPPAPASPSAGDDDNQGDHTLTP